LKNTFEDLTKRVKADFRIKLEEIKTTGSKTTLDGHTEFLKQLQYQCEDIERLLLTLKTTEESSCSIM